MPSFACSKIKLWPNIQPDDNRVPAPSNRALFVIGAFTFFAFSLGENIYVWVKGYGDEQSNSSDDLSPNPREDFLSYLQEVGGSHAWISMGTALGGGLGHLITIRNLNQLTSLMIGSDQLIQTFLKLAPALFLGTFAMKISTDLVLVNDYQGAHYKDNSLSEELALAPAIIVTGALATKAVTSGFGGLMAKIPLINRVDLQSVTFNFIRFGLVLSSGVAAINVMNKVADLNHEMDSGNEGVDAFATAAIDTFTGLAAASVVDLACEGTEYLFSKVCTTCWSGSWKRSSTENEAFRLLNTAEEGRDYNSIQYN